MYEGHIQVHHLIAEANEEEASCRGHALDSDDLYDLAWHLTRNEREVERLVASTPGKCLPLDVRRSRPDGGVRKLVRSYLQTRAPSSILSRLATVLKTRKKTSSMMMASSFEAGLGRLSPEERVCLILRERLELPITEIADITGLEHETVRRALFSAREQLSVLVRPSTSTEG